MAISEELKRKLREKLTSLSEKEMEAYMRLMLQDKKRRNRKKKSK